MLIDIVYNNRRDYFEKNNYGFSMYCYIEPKFKCI